MIFPPSNVHSIARARLLLLFLIARSTRVGQRIRPKITSKRIGLSMRFSLTWTSWKCTSLRVIVQRWFPTSVISRSTWRTWNLPRTCQSSATTPLIKTRVPTSPRSGAACTALRMSLSLKDLKLSKELLKKTTRIRRKLSSLQSRKSNKTLSWKQRRKKLC